MKGARALFTEEYNCQKNKRSPGLFVRAAPRPDRNLIPRCVFSVQPVARLAPAPPSSFFLLPAHFRSVSSALCASAPEPSAGDAAAERRGALQPPFAVPSIATPWRSSLDSRVNEFAITIFHVDVATYSLVDFGIPDDIPGPASARPRPPPFSPRLFSSVFEPPSLRAVASVSAVFPADVDSSPGSAKARGKDADVVHGCVLRFVGFNSFLGMMLFHVEVLRIPAFLVVCTGSRGVVRGESLVLQHPPWRQGLEHP